jgi:hypothetical protein
MESPLPAPRRWSVLSPLPLWARLLLWTVLFGALFGYYQLRALGHFRTAWVSAHNARDTDALASLVCWDDVSADERQRMRLLLAQEAEHPLRSADVQLAFGAEARPGWRPNRWVVARLVVVYDTPERLTFSFPVGLAGVASHQLAMMVPVK